MYSVILMTVMTVGAPEAPQFGLKHRGATSGCTGGNANAGCAGCSGHGGGLGGGYGSGPGQWAGWGWGAWYPVQGWNWTYGGSGGWFGMGTGWGHTPYIIAGYDGAVGPARIAVDPWGADYSYSASVPFVYQSRFASPKSQQPMEDPKETASGGARLILEVPADAKVTIDGQPVQSTSGLRHFTTPVLDPKQTYFYDVSVETVTDGRPVRLDRRVIVKANQVVRESFQTAGTPARGVASK